MCGCCWPAGDGTACCIGDCGAEPCFWATGGVGVVAGAPVVAGILADAVGSSDGLPPRPAAVWGDAGG